MVSRKSMCTLARGEWLGDEVVNMYMKILQARNREAVANGKPVPRCGMVNSFFFSQLSDGGRGYRYNKRFLKRAQIDLFDLDKFIFPVNVAQVSTALQSMSVMSKSTRQTVRHSVLFIR
ncbi:unnamed protein product [Sphacelaria rigidula]